ncbi:MAG: hypothetical protein IPK81_03930 [Rhodospirillales bacterium]|nr:hypothetical protein [Rhodospirillales bacterium]QQS13407.1 MAG: hypothetical protein IPK81_03930 [Rhodospirillales bacterium]
MITRLAYLVGVGAVLLGGVGRVEAQGAGTRVGAGVADGTYRCHKLSPSGGLRQMGTMEVRGGMARLPGLPDDWTVQAVAVRGTNSRGETVVAFDYRSAAGISDRLDCIRQ